MEIEECLKLPPKERESLLTALMKKKESDYNQRRWTQERAKVVDEHTTYLEEREKRFKAISPVGKKLIMELVPLYREKQMKMREIFKGMDMCRVQGISSYR